MPNAKSIVNYTNCARRKAKRAVNNKTLGMAIKESLIHNKFLALEWLPAIMLLTFDELTNALLSNI